VTAPLAERALPLLDQHYREVFNAAPHAYLLFDTNLRIVGANHRFLRITSTTRDQIIGRELADAFGGGGAEGTLRTASWMATLPGVRPRPAQPDHPARHRKPGAALGGAGGLVWGGIRVCFRPVADIPGTWPVIGMAELPDEMRDAVRQLIAHAQPGRRARLLADLDMAEVEAGNAVGSIFQFRLPGYRAHPRSGQRPLLVEGKVQDADGEILDVVLHVDPNGRLYELELLRWADGDVIGPDWRTFAV
jgi:hypothetical protein